MNNDLISRSALITAIQDHFDNLDVYFPSAFIKEVEEAPTVTPTFGLFKEMLCSECEKRPQGEWIDCGEYYKCPFCGNWVLEVDGKPNYCDECGADMRKGGVE